MTTTHTPDMLIESLKLSQWIDFRRENGSQLGSYSSAEILRRIDKLIADLERCKAALRDVLQFGDAGNWTYGQQEIGHPINNARALLAELDKGQS